MTAISRIKKQTTLSGIQPSGKLHIGNYLGALKNFVALQANYECYFMIADEHSLTEGLSPDILREQTLNLAASYLAASLDPKKSTIFLQSFVPEHTELAWIFSTITPMGELERMTQYKDKAARQKSNINAGLFSYPVLQAADILLYKPPVVPIGEDQTQHLEITRTIARRFNNRYGRTFPEPKALFTAASRVMSLTDPERKMSKSEPSGCLFLEDSSKIIEQKIKRAVTDTGPAGEEMSLGVKNLFLLLREFSDSKTVKKFETNYVNGSIRYSELKEVLAHDVASELAPFQKKYATLIGQPKKLMSVLKNGSKKARLVAEKTLQEVKQKIGLLAM